MRTFESGATRNLDESKLDFEGFFSPLVMERFAEYMHKHRKQADGKLRDSDNWQKGIPLDAYMKSGYRHFFDWWKEHRGISTQEGLEDSLCALLFNVQGYLHECLVTYRLVEVGVAEGGPVAPGTAEFQPKSLGDDWVEWIGTDYAPKPVGSWGIVEVRCRSGRVLFGRPSAFDWGYYDEPDDIIAYRVVKEGE